MRPDDLIDELGLSVRSTNALKRGGIFTVEKLLECSESRLYAIHNLGKLSVEEIIKVQESLQEHIDENETEPEMLPEVEEAPAHSLMEYAVAHDQKIEELNLSRRLINSLKRGGYRFRSDFLEVDVEVLSKLQNMGRKSLDELVAYREKYIRDHESDILAFDPNLPQALPSADQLRIMILDLYKDEPFRGYSFAEAVSALSINAEGLEQAVKAALGSMLQAGELEYADFRCHRVYPHFADYVRSCEGKMKDNQQEFLLRKLAGQTLEEIGAPAGLSRERVRQIVKRALVTARRLHLAQDGTEVFDEDYYRNCFRTYYMDKKEIPAMIGISSEGVEYLLLAEDHGNINISQAEEDPNLTPYLKYRLRVYSHRKALRIRGEWVPRRRGDLEKFVISRFCTEATSFDEFVNIYNRVLLENGIGEDDPLYYNESLRRSRVNILADENYLLWRTGGILRWYDMESRDFSELLDTLSLDSYHNIELSTEKFMRHYPELMGKYDIRDKYELHNLLRKIVPDGQYPELTFSRMPMISFGEFDRAAAFRDIMMEMAPVTAEDLAERICEEYGIEPATALASPEMTQLKLYYHQGLYSIEEKVMLPETLNKLISALDEDFYFFDELRSAYSEVCPEGDIEEINPYSLKLMGFAVNSSYVYRGAASADAWFRKLLTSREIFDMIPIRRRYGSIQMFNQVCTDMKKKYAILEYEPDQYLTFERLEKADVSLHELTDFCNQVYGYLEDGQFFTMKSLRDSGFDASLFGLEMSDWFYGGLLAWDGRFSYSKGFGTLLLCKGKADVGLGSFAEWIVNSEGSVDMLDLLSDFTDKYGCRNVLRGDILHKIKGTPLWYDDILDRVYSDKEQYYQDIGL